MASEFALLVLVAVCLLGIPIAFIAVIWAVVSGVSSWSFQQSFDRAFNNEMARRQRAIELRRRDAQRAMARQQRWDAVKVGVSRSFPKDPPPDA